MTFDPRQSLMCQLNVLQERSSAQRKQLFKDIQTRDNTKPRQLLLDMPVRWSSTFVMLERAEAQRKVSINIVTASEL